MISPWMGDRYTLQNGGSVVTLRFGGLLRRELDALGPCARYGRGFFWYTNIPAESPFYALTFLLIIKQICTMFLISWCFTTVVHLLTNNFLIYRKDTYVVFTWTFSIRCLSILCSHACMKVK